MIRKLNEIIRYLNEERRIDFSGNRPAMIARRIGNRLSAVGSTNFQDYLGYLEKHPEELDNLIDALTINVSRFFRNTLTFEYIAHKVLPAIIIQKTKTPNSSLRVWSAGCSTGEEPYSVAILINEVMEKEGLNQIINFNIFATDIDKDALKKARAGIYPLESIKDIKYCLLKKYFTINDESFTLNSKIKEMVSFSVYNMLDKKTYVPPESVFGNFDLVLCRNVLIYFQTECQDIIFGKLHKSLSKSGYLVLGKAEMPLIKYQRYLVKENECCHIYRVT